MSLTDTEVAANYFKTQSAKERRPGEAENQTYA